MRNLILILIFLIISGLPVFANDDLQLQAENGDVQAQFDLGMSYWQDYKNRDYAKALPWLLKAAEQNHPEAAYYVGTFYELGQGTEPDSMEALKWHYRAIALGNTEGYFAMGRMHYTGAGIPRNYDEAWRWWNKGVELGDGRSESALERLFADGKSKFDAEALITKAESGDVEAQFELAEAYLWGRIVPRNFQKAAIWMTAAAEAGHIRAQANLGNLYSSLMPEYVSKAEGEKWLARAALQGDSASLSFLTLGHLYGNQDFERNYAEMLKWIEIGVALNDPNTLSLAAPLHLSGALMPWDTNFAAQLYIREALQNDDYGNSAFELGRLYEANHITADLPETAEISLPGEAEPDPAGGHYLNAARWYYYAALRGKREAPYYLARLLENGLGVSPNPEAAERFYQLAFEEMSRFKSMPSYMFPLADMYYRGKGTQQDTVEALKLLQALFTNLNMWHGQSYVQHRHEALALAALLDKTARPAEKTAVEWDTAGFLFYHNGEPFNVAAARNKAETGDIEMQFELGLRYLEGAGVRHDYAESLKWLTRAAEAGDARAMFVLATVLIYSNVGSGPAALDVQWYIKAAELDCLPAQHWLIMLYEYGMGVEPDLAAAYYWAARYFLNPANIQNNANWPTNLKNEITPAAVAEVHAKLEQEGFKLPEDL